MIIDIDPDCYKTPTSPKYSKSMGDMYQRGYIHRALVVLEIDSVGSPSTPIIPANSVDDMARGSSSQRNFYISIRPRYVDETLLQYSMTGLQGSFMFQLAKYVERGTVRVVSEAGTVRTAKSIIDYAVSSVPQAGVWA